MNGQVCQGIPVDLGFLLEQTNLKMEPVDTAVFDTLEASQEGCIQALTKLDLKEACCMYVKYEEPEFEDFDLMVFEVMELDETIIDPIDV